MHKAVIAILLLNIISLRTVSPFVADGSAPAAAIQASAIPSFGTLFLHFDQRFRESVPVPALCFCRPFEANRLRIEPERMPLAGIDRYGTQLAHLLEGQHYGDLKTTN